MNTVADTEGSELKGGRKPTFGPVKFFAPAALGVEVEAAKQGVCVRLAGKAFSRAGLREGDLITEFDGRPLRTPEGFRRLLRKRVVLEGRAELLVRRDGKSLALRVPID